MIGIYQIRNIENGKLYIGQSTNIKHRFQQHIYDLTTNKHKNKSMQKDYNDNHNIFVFEVLKQCSKEELDTLEAEYVERYKTTNVIYGYNILSGGKKGIKLPIETIKKISIAQKGNKHMCGIKLTDEWKRNLSLSQPHRRKVRCLETNEIFYSIAEASRQKNINRPHISQCCTGVRKIAGGFHWEYADG